MPTPTFELTITALTAAEARFTAPQHAERVVVPIALDPEALAALLLDPETYGAALTAQLFDDQRLSDAWLQARALALAGGALAVRLRLDPADAALHALRWETLRDPVDNQPFALSQRVRLARTLDGGAGFAPLPLVPRPASLRALVVVAAPSDLADYRLAAIDADGELARARAALGDIPLTALGDATGAQGRATLEAIQAALGAGPQIVILIAHSTTREGQPVLFLEGADGQAAPVFGAELVAAVQRQAQRPLLLVLVSCKSAGDDYAALTAIGPRLAQVGLPAVLSFQGDIAMTAVKRLLPRLIEEARTDGQIDRALAAARAALGSGGPWWQPVLFLRGDGRLWVEPQDEAQDAAAQPSQTINNQASNQGAQGNFYGPVTFNQPGGISVGGNVGSVQQITVSGGSVGSIIGSQHTYGSPAPTPAPAASDPAETLRLRLTTQRETLSHHLLQLAQLGSAYAPPGTTAGIREARREIDRIKAKLLSLNAQVVDHPDDEE
jgi:hypothetical protein